MEHDAEGRPQLEADPPACEDLSRAWELRLRDALLDAARRQQARRVCSR